MNAPKLTRIYVVVLVFSLALATITPLVLANFIGLTITDCHAILTNSEKAPIFLNGDAFRSSPKTPDAAWFAVDQYSLSSILKHDYKAYHTEHFTPPVPPAYYAEIKNQAWFVIIGCIIIFIVIFALSALILGKLVGHEYGTRLFDQAVESFGDPTLPFHDKINGLKAELAKTESELEKSSSAHNHLQEDLKLYQQEKGPIKYITKSIILSSKEERAIKSLGMKPEDYFFQFNKDRIILSEGKLKRKF